VLGFHEIAVHTANCCGTGGDLVHAEFGFIFKWQSIAKHRIAYDSSLLSGSLSYYQLLSTKELVNLFEVDKISSSVWRELHTQRKKLMLPR
jgi:hypothetical protein